MGVPIPLSSALRFLARIVLDLQFKIQPMSRKDGKHSEENNDNKFRKHQLQDDE